MQSQKIEPVDLDAQVHPDLKDFLAQKPKLNIKKETIAEVRKLSSTLAPTPAKYSKIPITTRHIPGPKDSPEVLVKIYNAKNDNTQRPALLFIHGGGYVLETPDDYDALALFFAYEADCVVVSPGYRLAPEHPYPAAIEDCYAALLWMKYSAQEIGINVKKIAVAGPSGGGGLCAALTLLARDRGGPELCFQIPLYPMIDFRNSTPSCREIVDPRVWNQDTNGASWEMYLGDLAKGEVPAYASPLCATDFSRLPPTYTFVGVLDPVRDETIEYVTKLLQAKVSVEFHIYPGCFHAFDLYLPNAGITKEAMGLVIKALKEAFQKVN